MSQTPRNRVLQLRVASAERDGFRAAARATGLTVASWARRELLMAATRNLNRMSAALTTMDIQEEEPDAKV